MARPQGGSDCQWPSGRVGGRALPDRQGSGGHLPGGETLREVFDRAFDVVEEIAQKHDGQTVAIFAHRVVNKLLVLGMLTLELERFPFIRQDNCCFNEFEWTEKGCVVINLNDTSHLRQAGIDLLKADF